MTITLSMPEIRELKPKILVIGVGGAGGNAVNNMIRSQLEGVEFVVANTDAQALATSLCDRRIQLGTKITEGLGAGSRPDVGAAAAEEAAEEIIEYMSGAHMAFITAGMGGGTGTGAAPVIARLARECGLLTVGVVTKPFQFEGSRRMTTADGGIEELQQFVDTLIIIPNQNLFRVANEKTTFADAFGMADNVLYSGVRGITDLMVMPGLINLDFADVRTVMSEMGKAMMGTGEAGGENRAIDAAESAIANPLLDDVSMKGARGVLINITGGPDLTLFEVDEAANRIRSEVDPEANIIVGSTFDDALDGTMRVSVFATGIDGSMIEPAERFLPSARRVAIEPSARPLPQTKPAVLPDANRPAAAQVTTQSLFNQDVAPALEEELDAAPELQGAEIAEAPDLASMDLTVDAEKADWEEPSMEDAPLSLDDLAEDAPEEVGEKLALADDFAEEAGEEAEDSVESRARAALDRAAAEEDAEGDSDVDLSAIEALRQRIESLTRQSDGFFADEPEMPEPAPQAQHDEPAQPEAMAEADLINAGPSRGASLMERMIKRVRKEPVERAEPMELSMADAIEEGPAPKRQTAAAQPAPRPAPQPAAASAPAQPTAERRPAAASADDEDAFEIPAFLRRQAN